METTTMKFYEEVIHDMGGRLSVSPLSEVREDAIPPKLREKVTINGRPARVTSVEMYLTNPPRPTGSFAFEFLDVCTCHERDSSVTCPACHAEGYFGHMEQHLQEEWDAIRGEN